MAAPILSGRTPVVNATNVYLNQLIYVVFDQAMLSSTLSDNTIIVYRTSDYEVISKTIEYNSSSYTVTVTPDVIFDSETTYNIVVVGVDQSSTCVKNASNESLATTATWYFTTGTSIYKAPEDTVAETQPEVEVADAPVAKVLEPKVSTAFSIVNTNPENYDSDQGTLLTNNANVGFENITIKFNNPVASGVFVESSWITLSAEAVDGDPTTTAIYPTGAVSNDTGYTLMWTPSDTQGWYVNNEIIVTVSENVKDEDGNLLGDDYQFMFTTKYRPLYCTVKKIRAVIGPFIRDINDDVINRNIYLNSLEAYNIANVIYDQGQWDIDSPTFAAKMWVCCKTQYDLLNAKLLDLSADGAAGMKRLGDFTIQEGSGELPGIKAALQKALDCMNAWMKQLLGKYRRAKAKMVVKGVSSPVTPPMRGVRTWATPYPWEGKGANKRRDRRIKSPGIYEEWS